MSALLCALAFLAAGCHNNNQTSGYGVAWVTLTDQPGDFSSYLVNIDSVTLTRNDSATVTALATVERVDFTKLKNIAELWGTATVPVGTYVSATIVVDYTSANISVLVNGVPQTATVHDSAGAAVTTQTVIVTFDPANPLVISPTYATTAAQRLAIDFDLAASTSSINLATTPATVTVKPFMTAGISASDQKLVRVRGPLINSSVGQQTYSVYVRPFYDEANSLGSLTVFNDANTIYSINGTTYVGAPGIDVLSRTSAGTTMTAAYTIYTPTATPSATAAKWMTKYVIAGSSFEDQYTQGFEGYVLARNGNTLTIRGGTLSLNDGTSTYHVEDAVVTVGPGTIVSADNNATLTGLTYNSISVGQHIVVRGIYSLPANVVTFDATGTSTNTGYVRLLPMEAYGALVSSTTGSLVLNLQTLDNWPAGIFNFSGNGATAAQDTLPAAYSVNTGPLAVPTFAAGDPVWVDGITTPFGAAPPDFLAYSVNAEVAVPATLEVSWTAPGTTTPLANLTAAGFSVDLTNPAYSAGVIRVGPESVDLATLGTSLQVVPQVVAASTTPASATTPPAAFTPLFAVGNTAGGISVFSGFDAFVTKVTTTFATTPALQLEARGVFDRATNTFTATTVNVVL